MKNKNYKPIALFMVYLVFTIIVFQSAVASAAVNKPTGDLSVSIPLMTVPGVNGLDQDINLVYTGGDGIKTTAEAGWVGLGWSLDVGSVTRAIVGIPDDYNSYIHMYLNVDVEDTSTFWEKMEKGWAYILAAVIVTIVALFTLQIETLPWIWAAVIIAITAGITNAIAQAIHNDGKIDMNQVLKTMGTAFIFGGLGAYASSLGALAKFKEVYAIFSTFQSVKGAANALNSMIGSPGGASYKDPFLSGKKEAATTPNFQSGYLYNPTFKEAYADNNPLLSDGGKPDIWSISGGPFSGKMIIVDKDTLGRYETTSTKDMVQNNVLFSLENPSSKDNFKIEFFVDKEVPILSSIDYFPFQISGLIDQFVITTSDGTRYVFGDPKVSGSTPFEYRQYSNADFYENNQAENYKYFIEMKTKLFGSDIYQWKLVSILSPDYIDAGGNRGNLLNPLDGGCSGTVSISCSHKSSDECNKLPGCTWRVKQISSSPYFAAFCDGETSCSMQEEETCKALGCTWSDVQNKGSWLAFRYDLRYQANNVVGGVRPTYRSGSVRNNYDKYESGRINNFKSYSNSDREISYLREVISPNYRAVFEVSERLDGTEAVHELDVYYTIDSRILSIALIALAPSFTIDSLPLYHLYKLDSITLKSRMGTEPVLQKIIFNKDLSDCGEYLLKDDTFGGAAAGCEYRAYTLKTIDTCDGNGNNCYNNPYVFEYNNEGTA
ncbi:MAG: hypothetical protein KKH40_02700 [Nanoarchaeota archaeon]|nr:hypothetical protein [Nanoarchaeota archaeon]